MSGHRPNGDPVQAHSAGPIYPFVIYRQENNGDTTWGVIGPNCQLGLGGFDSYKEAERFAHHLKGE